MLNTFFIRLVMLARPLLVGLGVDMVHLKVILQTKCAVDDRRPAGLAMYKNSSSKSSEWAKNIMFLILGALLCGILFVPNLLAAHALYLLAFMIYLINSLIIDFSNVLIDVRDHHFIASRPVNDKTIAVARILHIIIYLSKMFLPLILPAMLVVFIKSGIIAGLLFLAELVAATTLSLFSVYVIYMLMMQIIKPQRFRDIIAYFQIGFSTLILGSYIIFPRLLADLNLAKISLLDYRISYFLPPVWIATFQRWTTGTPDLTIALLSGLAIITPIICLIVIVKFLSGNFSDKLSMMGSATQKKSTLKTTGAPQKGWSDRMAALFTVAPMEQLGFNITWKLTSRMREFKVRTYPHVAYIPIYFVYFFFINTDRSWPAQWHHLRQTSSYLFLMYALGFLMTVLLRQITKSKKFKAAWIYQLTSNAHPGYVLSGMIKSLVAKYLLPSTVISVIIILSIWGFGTSLNLVYAFINVLLITIGVALLNARKFPFSEPSTLQEQKGRVFINIFLIFIPFALGYFQSYIVAYPLILTGLSVVFGGITWALFRTYKRLSWSDLLE